MVLTSGFTGTPVTRALILILTTTSLLTSMLDLKHYLPIKPTPHLWPYLQFSRILTFQLAYISSTELLFAVVLLYQCRVLERLWGARRFASFVVVTWSLVAVLVVGVGVVLKVLSLGWWGYLPPGLTGLVVALVVAWREEVPHVYGFRVVIGNLLGGRNGSGSGSSSSTTRTTNTQVGGVNDSREYEDEVASNPNLSAPETSDASRAPSSSSSSVGGLIFSDKFTTYIVISQLILSQFPYQLLPALTGWVVGVAWREELLPSNMMRWRVPAWVVGESGGLKGLQRGGLGGTGQRGGREQQYEGLRRRLAEEQGEQGNGGASRDGMREVSDRVLVGQSQGGAGAGGGMEDNDGVQQQQQPSSSSQSSTQPQRQRSHDQHQQRRGGGILSRMTGYFTTS